MKRKPSSLVEARIKNIYQNSVHAIELLQKHNLEILLNNAMVFIQRGMDAGDRQKIFRSGGVLLSMFNNLVSRIQDGEEKSDCQQLILDVLQFEIERLLHSASENERNNLVESLEIACDLHGYDMSDVSRRLNVPTYQPLHNKPKAKKLETPGVILNYELNLDEEARSKFVQRLYSRSQIFSKKKDAENLFRVTNVPTGVNIRTQHLDLLLVLIDQLYEKELLLVIGKSGKFLPLKQRLEYSDNAQLKNKDISKRFNKLKERNRKFTACLTEVEKFVLPFVRKDGVIRG